VEKVMIGVGDHAQFHLDESWRGLGLLCDLGYASMRLVRDCEQHNVRHVMRLKDSWKPKVLAVARGTLTKTFTPGTDLDVLIEEAEWDRLADRLNRKTDSSWRSRPSVLDQMRGWCIAPARNKRARPTPRVAPASVP
jgi:hypothetical protein